MQFRLRHLKLTTAHAYIWPVVSAIVTIGCVQSVQRDSLQDSRPQPVSRQICGPLILQRHTVETRWHPDEHNGVDFRVCPGQEITAIADGEVSFVYYDTDDPDGTGALITILHRLDEARRHVLWFRYAHVADVRVHKGQQVRRGDILGVPWLPIDAAERQRWRAHVHLEVSGKPRDPMPFLEGCHRDLPRGALAYPVSC